MHKSKDIETGKKQHWHGLLIALNFFIPFQGLQRMLESYMMEDRLPLSYFFILGLISAVIGGVLTVATKNRSSLTRVLTTLSVLVVVVFLNFMID